MPSPRKENKAGRKFFFKAAAGITTKRNQFFAATGRVIRYRGMMLAAATEVTASGSATIATVANALTKNPIPPGEGLMALALFLWATSSIVGLTPIAAVDTHKAAQENTQTKNRLNKRIRIRNTVIKAVSAADGTASISYGLAGLMLDNPGLIAAGLLYTTAAGIRFWGKQGKIIPRPLVDKQMPPRQQAKAYINYAKDILCNNPNVIAEAVTIPGLIASCVGLAQTLPLGQAVVINTAYLFSSFCRSCMMALQSPLIETKSPAANDNLMRPHAAPKQQPSSKQEP